MKRISISPRDNWETKVEEAGLSYHTANGQPYWNESAYYLFNALQIDILERAADQLHEMCIAAAEHITKQNLWTQVGIPLKAVPAILRSWERDDFSLYGRFDLAYDGVNPPKLLEYNADTPTSLLEASVIQWHWLQDQFPNEDQFNSIHENLIEAWKYLLKRGSSKVHFGGIKNHIEDFQTVQYLQDTCMQAGLSTSSLFIEDLGWNRDLKGFVDLNDSFVSTYFKLYPWEWMFHEPFWQHMENEDPCTMIEPCWKSILSNKGILPILWKLYPNNPYLLPAYFEIDPFKDSGKAFVKKPKLGREGANVTVFHEMKEVISTPGDYGDEGFVYQEYFKLPYLERNWPVCGVWMVNHKACGLGIREDDSLITGNSSRFVPHLFKQ